MTVASEVSRITYNGDGVSQAFPVPFYFLVNSDLVVLLVSPAGVSVTQILAADYTVVGAGVLAGGTVNMTVPPPAGYALIIYRDPAATQLTDYQANDPFPAETHERALDKLTMLVQRLRERVSRAFVLSDSDTTGASTLLPKPTANSVIGWNSTANALVNLDAGTLATTIVAASINLDVFSGTGAQTAFTLSSAPLAKNNTNVFVNGVYQQKAAYSLAGTTLTFGIAPVAGASNIEVEYAQALTFPVTSLSPNSVGTTELNALAVTTAKIANFAVTFGKLLANIFTSATTVPIVASDLLVFSDVSDSGNTKLGLVSDIVSLATSSIPSVPAVRQTVLSGPVDTSGFSNFGGATGATTVTVSGTLIATAANGNANRTGTSVNPAFTGLSTNGTMYGYLDIAADGTCATGTTTVAPTYRWGGADVVTNNQFTFNIQEMSGKVGNGATATQTYRVFVGEFTVAAGVVSAITWYALMGRFDSGYINTWPGSGVLTSFNHNIGYTPDNRSIYARCITADLNYVPGDVINPSPTATGTTVSNFNLVSTYKTIGFSNITAANPLAFLNKTSGVTANPTLASWAYRVTASRGW